MLNRNSIVALVALSAVGAVALASTSASARGFGGGGFGGGHNFGGGFGHSMSMSHTTSFSRTSSLGHNTGFNRSFASRGVNHTTPTGHGPKVGGCHFGHCGPGMHEHHKNVWWGHHPHWGVGDYPVVDGEPGPVMVDRVAAPVSVNSAGPGPCTCLTKTYLDDGSVMFKDLCTKEAALATPDELKAQAQGAPPQARN